MGQLLKVLSVLSLLAFAQGVRHKRTDDGGDAPAISKFHFLGPFPVGKTEYDGDPVEAIGGIASLTPGDASFRIPSELVDGGFVSWTTLNTDNGRIVVQFPNVRWNDLVQAFDIQAAEFQGWMVAPFKVTKAGRYMLSCTGLHTLELDAGTLINGDIYGDGFVTAVTLNAGEHVLRSRVRGKAHSTFQCSFSRPNGGAVILRSRAVPDVVEGVVVAQPIDVPVLNAGETWLHGVRIEVTDRYGKVLTDAPPATVSIAPGQVLALEGRFALQDSSLTKGDSCTTISLRVLAKGEEIARSDVPLRCRLSSESTLFTFIDHDGSVVVAAIIRPWETCPSSGCPVLLTMSGVGVSPGNQADSHKYGKVKKRKDAPDEYNFGFRDTWVLAPQREGAHNWEGQGHLCAMHSLQALARIAPSGYAPDLSRLLLSGHSRGGHGALLVALRHPDRVLGLFAGSGWLNREVYGDANTIFRHDVQLSYMEPSIAGLLTASVAENYADLPAANLKGIPALLRVGADDKSVPPLFFRQFVRLLAEVRGNDTNYPEPKLSDIPKQGHWWWDTKEANDGGAVFDPEIRDFYSTSLRARPYYPAAHEVVSFNPMLYAGRGGIRILQLETSGLIGKLSINRDGSSWTVTSKNVRRWCLDTSNTGFPAPTALTIDGVAVSLDGRLLSDPSVTVLRTGRRWQLDTSDAYLMTERTNASCGPLRQVFARPVFVVVGTTGSTQEQKTLMETALYIANSHYIAQHTRMQIILDHELTSEKANGHNLLLLGTPSENEWVRTHPSTSPVKFTEGAPGFTIDGCVLKGPRVGAVFLAASASDPQQLFLHVAATDRKGYYDVVRNSFASNQAHTRAVFTNMLPDAMITGPEFGWKGYGGVLALGFYNSQWQWQGQLDRCLVV